MQLVRGDGVRVMPLAHIDKNFSVAPSAITSILSGFGSAKRMFSGGVRVRFRIRVFLKSKF